MSKVTTTSKIKHNLRIHKAVCSLCSTLLIATTAFAMLPLVHSQSPYNAVPNLWSASMKSIGQKVKTVADASVPDTVPFPLYQAASTPELRRAKRVQERLRKDKKPLPGVASIEKALDQRSQLLNKSVSVSIVGDDGTEFASWTASVTDNPTWVRSQMGILNAQSVLDIDAIEQTVAKQNLFEDVPTVQNIHISSTDLVGNILRADTNQVGRSGYDFSEGRLAETIATALVDGQDTITYSMETVAPQVRAGSESDFGDLQLLSVGRSNFKGSSWARKKNVEKALSKHVHNTVVAPGETFSFNETLGGPVTVSRGWKMAKVIFGGSELREAAGGGICQASTTLYRSLLQAGLPVTERRAHSLYVSYYKEHGVGIDATIYPGSQDLVFENDTDSHILIQAFNDGYDAYVAIYGKSDGREVALQGPFFSTNAPEDLDIDGRSLKRNEIAWTRSVTYSDNTVAQETILSRYRHLPYSVISEYAEPEKQEVAVGEDIPVL